MSATLALLLGLAACTKNDSGLTAEVDGAVLTFTVGIEGSATTRSTVDNYFDSGDEISVTLNGETATYQYDGSAWITSTPYYWKGTEDAVTVEAECFGGSATGDYAVRADQNAFDAYQAGDYLYAPEITFTYGASNALTFYHQTAKLMLNFVDGDIVPDNPEVTIGDNNLALAGTFTKPTSGSNFGTWTPGEQTGSITPYRLSYPNAVEGKTIKASYVALVVPQSLTAGTELISIVIDGQTYSYELSATVTWKPGYVYTYTVTVKQEGLEVIETTIYDWVEGGSTEAEMSPIYAYSASTNTYTVYTADGIDLPTLTKNDE